MRNLYTVKKTRAEGKSVLGKVLCTIGATIVFSVLILLCDVCRNCDIPIRDLIVAISVTTIAVALIVAWAFLMIVSIFEERENDNK